MHRMQPANLLQDVWSYAKAHDDRDSSPNEHKSDASLDDRSRWRCRSFSPLPAAAAADYVTVWPPLVLAGGRVGKAREQRFCLVFRCSASLDGSLSFVVAGGLVRSFGSFSSARLGSVCTRRKLIELLAGGSEAQLEPKALERSRYLIINTGVHSTLTAGLKSLESSQHARGFTQARNA